MRSSTKGALAAAAFAFLSGSAFGQSWSDGFEAYAPNDTIPGSATFPFGPNDWQLWVSSLPLNIVEDTSATIGTAGGTNSMHVFAGTDLVANWNEGATGAPNSGQYEFRASVYSPSSSLGEQFWILLNTYAFGGPYSWSVQVHMDPTAGTVVGDVGGAAGPGQPAVPVSMVQDAWVELYAAIDLDADEVTLTYNGEDLTANGDPYSWTGTVFGGGAGNLEIQALDVYPGGATTDDIWWDEISLAPEVGPLGTNYCNPVPNSTGGVAVMSGFGSTTASANNVTITCDGLPAGQPGYFINSQAQGFVNPPGSNGFLCLSGAIGRHNQPGLVFFGPSGSIQVDTTAVPTPSAFVAINPGETWNWQCWYRDIGNTNNFSDGLEVLFN